MKCAEDHMTYTCTKPTTTPPKCSNCGGEHLSTYIKCEKNPNNGLPVKYVEAPLPKSNPWLRNRDVNERKNETRTADKKDNQGDDLATTLGRMLITLNNTNATHDQKMEFILQTERITKLFNKKDK